MQRREFIRLVSAAPIAISGWPQGQSGLQYPVSSFNLGLAPGEQVRHVAVHSERLYVATQHRDSPTLLCVGSGGNVLWRRPLDGRSFYLGMVVMPSGRIVVGPLRRGAGFEIQELDNQGDRVRSFPVDPANLNAFDAATESTLFGIQRDGTFTEYNLTQAQPTFRYRGDVFPGAKLPQILVVSPTSLMVLDRATAEFVLFQPLFGTTVSGRLESPEVERSRADRGRLSQSGGQPQRGYHPIIAACCVGSQGRVYALIVPFRREPGLPIEEFSSEGRHLRTLRCTMTEAARLVPFFLRVVHTTLFTIYLDGYVAGYRLA